MNARSLYLPPLGSPTSHTFWLPPLSEQSTHRQRLSSPRMKPLSSPFPKRHDYSLVPDGRGDEKSKASTSDTSKRWALCKAAIVFLVALCSFLGGRLSTGKTQGLLDAADGMERALTRGSSPRHAPFPIPTNVHILRTYIRSALGKAACTKLVLVHKRITDMASWLQ